MRLLLLVFAGTLLVSCGSQPPPPPSVRTRADAFDEARAWKHLEALCRMGPRPHGSEAQKKEQEYLRSELAACGAQVRDLPFRYRGREDGDPQPFTTIAGRFRGKGDKWVLLGSHYDTRSWADKDPDMSLRDKPFEGANDGGSGVAVLLEVARVLKEQPPDIGVEIVFFDGEDYGRPGSDDYFVGSKDMAKRWGELYPGPRPACAVIVDMVGEPDLRLSQDARCAGDYPWLNDLLWKAAGDLRVPAFSSGTTGATDDHSALIGIGIPATLLIDRDFMEPPHHTMQDTLDKCSAHSLGAVGRVLLRALVDQPFEVPQATPSAPK